MKPLFSSLVKILERRAERGNASYWPAATFERLREAANREDYPAAAVAEALAEFAPSWPNGSYFESSASLDGVISVVEAFLSQASLPSALVDRVAYVVDRLKKISAHVAMIEQLCAGNHPAPASA